MSLLDRGPLRDAGPVDGALLHRRHPEEMFLTGAEPTGPATFRAAAVLPAEHPHYRAHTGPSRHRDPMLLLECARQAETYAAHTLYGVPADARFVLRRWSASFAHPEPGTTAVRLTGTTRDPRRVGGRLAGMTYDLDLSAGDQWQGTVSMDVDHPSAAVYRVLRGRKHTGGLPSSDDLPPAGRRPVDPVRVGRLRPTDTILDDLGTTGGTITAVLRVPVENRSLFDHAQDHVPAMVLMEAARQIAALAVAAWGGPRPDRSAMTGLDAAFTDYAELTSPVVLIAGPSPGGGPARVQVAFEQADAVIATCGVTVSAPGRGTPCPAPRS